MQSETASLVFSTVKISAYSTQRPESGINPLISLLEKRKIKIVIRMLSYSSVGRTKHVVIFKTITKVKRTVQYIKRSPMHAFWATVFINCTVISKCV